jgi:dipeptidyl aminopeptidase/acylaminoacyl peptidase
MSDNPELFVGASPTYRVHRDAPPFFILHGRNDDIVPLEQARTFNAALRDAGAGTVAYAEIPHAHHAFDTIATLRCQLTTEAVAAFLGIVYGRHLAGARRGGRARRSAS